MESSPDTELNELQQHRLVVTCQYVNRLLTELEHAFGEAQSPSPFNRYVNDLVPAEQHLVQDYIARTNDRANAWPRMRSAASAPECRAAAPALASRRRGVRYALRQRLDRVTRAA
jgi:hypothetical protein